MPSELKQRVGRLLGAPPERMWLREVMNQEIAAHLSSLGPERLSAVEISGDFHRDRHPWRRHTSLRYPEFDLCSDSAPDTFDVVLCEQVIEHVPDPWAAVRTLRNLAKPGGLVVVSTPFLIRIHYEPTDYWRFTPDAMRLLLEQAGLDDVTVASWGNRQCVRRNFRRWSYRRARSLKNEPLFPVVIWGFARRPV